MARVSALASDAVRLVPLGGLGEIGMNCFALEQSDGILVVDCGIAFPDNDLGVDVVHADFSWLLERSERIAGVFLTHGHEDHVGALPYLLNEIDVPVWGPPHALAVARRRLLERDFLPRELDLRPARAGERHAVGPFRVEPVRVTHSIVEASALSIATRAGIVLHTGDFNLDPDPPDGEPTNEARLAAIGDAGVALMLSDSTNSHVPERSGSERSVARAVEGLAERATGRVVVSMFASNVQRLITFGDIARRLGRKICVFGRSLDAQIAIAKELGYLRWPSDLTIGIEEAQGFPRERLFVLAGGTQAEPGSALQRFAVGQHPALKLEPGDSVILSSRVIPGNERGVAHLHNDLLRLGVTLHSWLTDPEVHTSGHAARNEQLRMIELLRPRCFLPVHGQLQHLLSHAELARDAGAAETAVVEDGTPIVCDGHSLVRERAIQHGRVSILKGGEPASESTLRARAELARSGIVTVALVEDERGRSAAAPRIAARGVPGVEDDAALRALELEAARAVDAHRDGRGLDRNEFVRRAVRRKVEDLSGTRPVVEVLTSRVD
ncbi:MAG TPA: ribonuclease J [Polyangiaceae bacterium]